MTKMTYSISYGGVQSYVIRYGDKKHPMFLYHFGRVECDVKKPILTQSLKDQAQPIVDKLNAGTITEEEAKKELDKVYW